jgi:hypothetical protein
MKATKIVFVMLVIVLSGFLPSVSAQSSRLNDLSNRLTTEASSFADNSYRAYTSSFRVGRNDIDQVMLAQQFSAGAQLFRRMVTDGRRDSELRDAFSLLENLQRSLDSYAANRWRWSEIQRLMGSISNELRGGIGGPWPPQGQPPDQREHGRMTWRGTVDHDVKIIVRGNTAEVVTLSGNPYNDANSAFTAQLPLRRVNVTLTVRKARGQITLEEQPSRANDYSVVVHIRDPKSGGSDYEFELSW